MGPPPDRGLIPAHAGKTRVRRIGQWRSAAHPRSRGENPYARIGGDADNGSSPLTRGKRGRGSTVRWSRGLIPAHAGKTSGAVQVPASVGAHPRSRGENVDGQDDVIGKLGSSPLTRGKQVSTPDSLSDWRLIPAHAGKTPPTTPPRSRTRAHPRSRGENPTAAATPPRPSGSSPLTRGKPPIVGAYTMTGGLIPAHAGKTHPPGPRRRVCAAHPRSRGENTRSASTCCSATGSSPLTRGKPEPSRRHC